MYTSFHEILKRVFKKRVFLRCSRNGIYYTGHETSAHEMSFCVCSRAQEKNFNWKSLCDLLGLFTKRVFFILLWNVLMKRVTDETTSHETSFSFFVNSERLAFYRFSKNWNFWGLWRKSLRFLKNLSFCVFLKQISNFFILPDPDVQRLRRTSFLFDKILIQSQNVFSYTF